MAARSLAFLILAFFTVNPAFAAPKAAELTIDTYFGEWQGTATAMSETDEDFPTSKRDIAISLSASKLGGFVLSWSTLQRQKGNPKAPLEVMKSTNVEFIPAPRPNTWRAKHDADPYSGGILYWARLDGSGLIVSSFTISAEGKPEFQTYRRRVIGNEMKLEFSNVTDGKFVRTVKGQLRRLKAR